MGVEGGASAPCTDQLVHTGIETTEISKSSNPKRWNYKLRTCKPCTAFVDIMGHNL